MTPFPHILTRPGSLIGLMRIVSDLPVEVGSVISGYLIREITGSRPARGDWSAYPVIPTYYECYAEPFSENTKDPQ